MKNLLPILALAVVGCIDIPTGANDHIEALTNAAEVSSVVCAPVALEIAILETGFCSARNVDGTVIDIDGFSPVVWQSSDPTAVTVSMGGDIFAGINVSTSVIITAKGTNGTSASFAVSTF